MDQVWRVRDVHRSKSGALMSELGHSRHSRYPGVSAPLFPCSRAFVLALHWPTVTCISPLFGDAIAGRRRRNWIKGALAMRNVAVYIAFVLSTAWLLFGSWQLPTSGNHARHEATNVYWQDTPRALMTDEGETEAKVSRAEGEQLSKEE